MVQTALQARLGDIQKSLDRLTEVLVDQAKAQHDAELDMMRKNQDTVMELLKAVVAKKANCLKSSPNPIPPLCILCSWWS